jgi:hypothetical protein
VPVSAVSFGRSNKMPPFHDEAETYRTLAEELSHRKLAYVHISDQTTMGEHGTIPVPKNYLK